jgi:hypothetical protein
MIEVEITEEVMKQAGKKAAEMTMLNGSITNGTSNVLGCMGEILVQKYLKASPSNTYDYDIVHAGRRIDVKTKRCDSEPRLHYDCSVAAHGSQQDCDEYVFVRILHNFKRAWILGSITKQDFYDKAKRWSRGDIDPDNNYTFRADCYNIPISELKDVA